MSPAATTACLAASPDIYALPPGFRIVSGGQSGADQAGLDWAIRHGVSHGGWCPRGRKTEEGPLPAHYLLLETPTGAYLQRTEWNVRDSDATAIFTLSADLEGGSLRTACFADRLGKPWIHMRPGVAPRFLARFLRARGVKTLNIAGSRGSRAPGIDLLVRECLDSALQPMRDQEVTSPWPGERGSSGSITGHLAVSP